MKNSQIAAAALFLILAFSVNAIACACCAEPGVHSTWSGKLDGYRLDVLQEMKFGKTANLYMTEAGSDGVRGLDSIVAEINSNELPPMSLIDEFNGNVWKLNFKTSRGTAGTLSLKRPPSFTVFKVDLHDTPSGQNTILYKEFRFSGTATGTGFFKAGLARPAPYKLVFQGRGNNCDNASDFTHFRVELDGPRARYAFFGKME
jgi:hypothetical protein